MFKINNRSTRDVVLVSLLLTLSTFDTLLNCFFADFDNADARCNTLSPLSNLSMHFRVGSRSPVTFKTKLCVATVDNSFRAVPIFCHKELHLSILDVA